MRQESQARKRLAGGLFGVAAALLVAAADTNAPLHALSRTIRHDAIGAEVRVSSTHRGAESEGEPAALVDGDLATRWSSDYASPQQIEIVLDKPRPLARLRLHWEQANATKYAVSVSSDGKDWKRVHLHFSDQGKPEDRVDDINLRDIAARTVKLELLANINTNWGYSLYEIELIAAKTDSHPAPLPGKTP